MSIQDAKVFYNRLSSDASFLNKLSTAKSQDEWNLIVKNEGYDFTPEELEEVTAQLLNSLENSDELRDLSDLELATVMGGLGYPPGRRLYPIYGTVEPYPWIPIDDTLPGPIIKPMYGVVIPPELTEK